MHYDRVVFRQQPEPPILDVDPLLSNCKLLHIDVHMYINRFKK